MYEILQNHILKKSDFQKILYQAFRSKYKIDYFEN